MPRTTNFRLTEDEERDLVIYALARVRSLRVDNNERIERDRRSWLAYENDVAWRQGDKAAIFKLSNLHIPLTGMVVEHFMSRSEEAIVDEPPYMSFEPVGPSDDTMTKVYDQYYNWKIDTKGKTFDQLQDGMLPIHIQRAAIFKATFLDDTREWIDRDRNILFDRGTNQPVEILNHGPIIENEDQFDDRPDPAAPAVPGMAPATRKHLQADPTFVMDPNVHEFRPPPDGLRRSETLYTGPKSILIDYDRFLCPSTAKSVEDADCCGDVADRGMDWFESMWLERPWAKWSDAKAQISSGNAAPKTEGDAKTDSKETLEFDTKNPQRKIIELWIRRDVLGWGKPQEFVLYLDEELQRAVWYEFQAKVCRDFKRPYTTIAIGKSKDRWWGKSIPEKIEQYQLEADKQFNGELYRNKIRSNPFKGGDRNALKDPDTPIESDPEAYLDLKQDRKIDEVLQFATIPDGDTNTQSLVQSIVSWVQLWLGVSDLAQGDYSAGENQKTAYGIEATLRESSKISKRWIRRIRRGFEEHVLKLVQIAMSTLGDNQVETFEFTEGDNTALKQMSGKDIRNVEINATLRLRQHQDEKDIERANTALEVQARYFATPDPLKPAVRPLLEEILTNLRFRNIEVLLPLPQMPAPGAGGALIPMETPPGDQPAAASA